MIISIVLDSPKALDRIDTKIDKNDAKINWKRFDDNSEPIIKKFRFQGNILEVRMESAYMAEVPLSLVDAADYRRMASG